MHLLFFLKFLLKLLYFKLWQPYLTDVHASDQNSWAWVHVSGQNAWLQVHAYGQNTWP